MHLPADISMQAPHVRFGAQGPGAPPQPQAQVLEELSRVHGAALATADLLVGTVDNLTSAASAASNSVKDVAAAVKSSLVIGDGDSSFAPTTPSSICGHVFLLHCDAQIVAADARLHPVRTVDRAALKKGKLVEVPNTGYGRARVFEGHISVNRADYEQEGNELVPRLKKVVRTYLATASEAVKGTRSRFGRSRPLIALPLPGVGKMDPEHILPMDTFARWILPELYSAANKYGVDVALCTVDEEAFRVMQADLVCLNHLLGLTSK